MKKNAFTLIEILIAAGIFVVVITVVISVFAFNVNLQSRSKVLQASSQNAKFIIESIARDVRLADDFSISEGENEIDMIMDEKNISYYFEEDEEGFGKIMYQEDVNDPIQLNSDDTDVGLMEISGVDFDTETIQSYLSIKIDFFTVKGTKKIDQTAKSVETTISTRSYSKEGFGGKTIIKQ